MPNIKLIDGNVLNFNDKVTGLQIAEKISKSLAKQAMVIGVDGQLKEFEIWRHLMRVFHFSTKTII